MNEKKIQRINELARKKKTVGLTGPEKVEQAKLRKEYIDGYRHSFLHHIAGIKIVDEDGNDVTPEKLRQLVCTVVVLTIQIHKKIAQLCLAGLF